MKQLTIHHERTTSADAESVWHLLGDSRTWPTWTPIDEHTPIAASSGDGTGEIRTFRNGRVTVREEIVAHRPGERLSYVLLAGLALRDYRADIDLTPAPGAGTLITWHTTFRPKVPGTGWLYRRALDKATGQFIDGLVAASNAGTAAAH